MIPQALNSVSDQLIWKYAQRAERIMDSYRQEVSYGTPEFQASIKHKYKSHWCVSDIQGLEQ